MAFTVGQLGNRGANAIRRPQIKAQKAQHTAQGTGRILCQCIVANPIRLNVLLRKPCDPRLIIGGKLCPLRPDRCGIVAVRGLRGQTLDRGAVRCSGRS